MQAIKSYLSENELQRHVLFALAEDISSGDITTEGTLSKEQRENTVTAKLIAKSDGVLAGSNIVELVFATLATNVKREDVCEFRTHDGESFQQGDVIAKITGPAGALLQAERTALNFVGRLSGIATLTALFVSAVSHTKCKILDTRKTTPGWRALEKYAVNCGGGFNHRIGLYDMVLIKENHIKAAGSIGRAIETVREYIIETKKDGIKLEVEVQNLAELEIVLKLDVNRVLLDNQSPAELRRLVTVARKLSPDTEIEASGNVTLSNVAEYAETGVDCISIGALTHSPKTIDLSLLIL